MVRVNRKSMASIMELRPSIRITKERLSPTTRPRVAGPLRSILVFTRETGEPPVLQEQTAGSVADFLLGDATKVSLYICWSSNTMVLSCQDH